MESTQVVIIGGGATGAGILWDLSLRGIAALLLEQGDVANGATGRCHGLLHSGGRYAVKDAHAAAECLKENLTLKRIAPHCVEDVGGLFVHCAGDDPAFIDQWHRAAEATGIEHKRLTADEAHALEPNLDGRVTGAFTCPDAHVDVFRLVLANLEAAVARGGRYATYSKVTALERSNNRITAVRYTNTRTGEEHHVACEVVVNASGGWAEATAALAGIHVPVRCDKGTLLVINHRLSSRVINRCRKPGDADILVPAGPVCILGTSSMQVPGPEGLTVANDEIAALLRTGAEMVPALAETRILRAFCGVRPLYVPRSAATSGGREISRGYALIDHESEDGLRGFVSIVGGKLTTYRLMAEATADCVVRKLGLDVACQTATTPLRAPASPHQAQQCDLIPFAAEEKLINRLGSHAEKIFSAISHRPELAEIVCECEFVTRAELEFCFSKDNPLAAQTINDVGRRTRLGFGPCQGTYCGYKAMLAGYQSGRWNADEAAREFATYLAERWKGQAFVQQGKQAEQFDIGHELYRTALLQQSNDGGPHA